MSAFIKEYSQLVGAKVTAVVRDAGKDGDMDECFGLQFSNGKIAWIMCDPEGNGPGFLDIQDDLDAPSAKSAG